MFNIYGAPTINIYTDPSQKKEKKKERKPKTPSKEVKKCYLCKKPGHLKKDCVKKTYVDVAKAATSQPPISANRPETTKGPKPQPIAPKPIHTVAQEPKQLPQTNQNNRPETNQCKPKQLPKDPQGHIRWSEITDEDITGTPLMALS